jgi:hypothetical protein
MRPLHAALANLVDYAGLFPPAGLDLQTTVANYDRYARSPEHWMLGRLVVPLARTEEVAKTLAGSPPRERAWTIAALVGPEDRLDNLPATLDRFHVSARTAGVTISAIEATLRGPDAVPDLAAVPVEGLERFVEVPLDATRDAWLEAIAASGCSVKVRTGGVAADRFPSSAALAAMLCACARRNLPLKATAGLHHAVRAAYPLTYEPGSPTGVMHGFVNLIVAALVLHTGAGTEADAERALETRDPRQFAWDETALRWDGHSFSADACVDTRAHLLRSAGSCSFEEPLADLRALGWYG